MKNNINLINKDNYMNTKKMVLDAWNKKSLKPPTRPMPLPKIPTTPIKTPFPIQKPSPTRPMPLPKVPKLSQYIKKPF
jgi:hypothetical protein